MYQNSFVRNKCEINRRCLCEMLSPSLIYSWSWPGVQCWVLTGQLNNRVNLPLNPLGVRIPWLQAGSGTATPRFETRRHVLVNIRRGQRPFSTPALLSQSSIFIPTTSTFICSSTPRAVHIRFILYIVYFLFHFASASLS